MRKYLIIVICMSFLLGLELALGVTMGAEGALATSYIAALIVALFVLFLVLRGCETWEP